MTRVSTFFLIAMLALGVGMAQAQDLGPAPGERVGTAVPPAGQMPELLQEVGLDQRLNAQVPLGLTFKDENGRVVKLGDYFGKRPVILTLNYFECPMLCTEVLNGLVSALGVMNFSIGKVQARRIMEELDISESRRLRGLGRNQREGLLCHPKIARSA